MDTFYWHVISNYLKARRNLCCERCQFHYKQTPGGQLNVHHCAYELPVGNQMMPVTGYEHLFVTGKIQVNGPILQVLCGRCHREIEGMLPNY